MAIVFTILILCAWIALIAILNILVIRNLIAASIVAGGIATMFMAIGLEEHMGRMWSSEYLKNIALMLSVYSIYALAIGFASKWLYGRLTNHLKKVSARKSST